MRIVFVGVAMASLLLVAAAADRQKVVYGRVFGNPGQVALFTAAADGGDQRPLLAAGDVDYDPAWSADGTAIVFTSDREGSADLFRVKADGSALERLTDDPAYDDQAAFSPDGKQLVFVSTRKGGFSHLWTMDLQTRRARQLTSGSGADFRPAWSPDGAWIAFASDRGSAMPFARGRWERLHLVDLYVIRPNGSGLKRVSAHGDFCGSPKWQKDSAHLVAYCMTAEQTLENRRPSPQPNDTRLMAFDVATGAGTEVTGGGGVMFNPSYVGERIGYVRKDTAGAGAGIYYTDGRTGPKGDIRSAAWSPDGRRVVFHKRVAATPPVWQPTWSRNPEFDLTLAGIMPSFSPTGDRYVMTGRPPNPSVPFASSIELARSGTNKAETIYRDPKRNVLGPQWSPSGDTILFSIGSFNAFFNGFNGIFLKQEERAEGGAQVAMVGPDGSGFHEVTSGANNNAFPSMAPDGKRFVYRSFGPEGDGLKIMNIETKAISVLTKGYDTFPLWSPRGDLIMFSRLAGGSYEIYTVKTDGTGARQLTSTHGNDAHQGWSPDGEQIVFASSRMGFKDEMIYTDAPQPYGEIFVMKYDGSNVRQLTDNQWEDGTPAFQPTGRSAPQRSSSGQSPRR